MHRLKAWPKWLKFCFFGALIIFWFSGLRFAYKQGNQAHFHTDQTTESMTIFASQHYLDHGFFKNYLLPTYPAFGHAPGGALRTEPFVYHHYLAGPDLTLGLFLKVVGRAQLWLGRMIPHTLTILAMAWLAIEFATLLKSPLMGGLMLGMLFIPKALRAWSICIYGHSYVMAFYLAMVAGLLALANRKSTPVKYACILGFLVGWLQMFFDLDWVPLTFLSAASVVCLSTRISPKHGRAVLMSMVLGGTLAVGYQFVVTSLYLGSAQKMISDTMEWMSFRTGTHRVEGISQGDFRLHKVLHEYNRQAYGATGFTAWNLVALSAAFLVLGFVGKVRDKKQFLRGLAALVLTYLAAVFWNVFMRQHSVAHTHFLPRHYFVLYMFFALTALPIAYALVLRARGCEKSVKIEQF